MGLLRGLFRKKETPTPEKPKQETAPKTVDITAGLDVMEVYRRENSAEKWRILEAFALKGDEIALQYVGEAYMLGEHVTRDDVKAEKYLLSAIEKGMTLSSVRLGQLYMRGAFDVYKNEANMTEEELQEADKAFDVSFRKGAYYLVKALDGDNLGHVEHAVQIIAGSIKLGYNVGDFRDYFMEQVNLYLSDAVRRIEAAVAAEDTGAASGALYKLGCLYLYGVHFEDDLDKAKEFFEKSLEKNKWNAYARKALENPLLTDD